MHDRLNDASPAAVTPVTSRHAVGSDPVAVMPPLRSAVIGALLITAGPLSMGVLTPALPLLAQELAIAPSHVTLLISLYLGAFAICQLLAGAVADCIGRRRTALVFAAIYVVGSLTGMAAESLWLLIVARLLQGVGVSSGLVVSRAMVRDQYSGDVASSVFSVTNTFNAVLPLIAPFAAALLLQVAPWRSVFAMMTALGIVMMIVSLLFLRESLPPSHRRPMQLRARLDDYVAILRHGAFLRMAMTIGLCIGGIYTMTAGLPFLMMDRLGLGTLGFGLVTMSQTSCFVAGSLLATRLSRRIGSARVTSLGIAAIFCGGVLFVLLPVATHPAPWSYMAGIWLWVMGNGLAMPGLVSETLRRRSEAFGAASAVLGFLQIGVGFVGSLTLGAVFADPVAGITVLVPLAATLVLVMTLVDRRVSARAATAGRG